MAKGEGLGIALPPQTKPGKESFDIRSGPLARWLRELPAGNISETTKQLYQALLDVNRHSHGWQRRYRFLEAIRGPLDGVQRSLERRYSSQSFPLPTKSQQVANLAQRFHTEMAQGYLAAIDDMRAASFLFQDRRALKVMMHRAARSLNLSLLVAYQTYTQQPPGIWQQLHRLYAFAEARDFHQDPIRDPLFGELPTSSIARIYKQAALLATTSPFSLRQGEATAIHQVLARWSAHAKLLQPQENGADAALFVIHLDADEEPEYRAMDNRRCDATNCRLIDTHQMVHMLQEEVGFASGTSRVLTPELCKSLIHGWDSPPKRSEHRNQSGSAIEAVIGMPQIHALLAPSLQSAAAPERSHFEARPLSGNERVGSANDVWNIYSGQGSTRQNPTVPRQPTSVQQPPIQATPLHCQARDMSTGGLRLVLPDGQEGGMRVGELLALRNGESQERWQLGQVRWLKRSGGQGLECGIQVLAPQMVPVIVTNLTPGRVKGEGQRGLLLPADESVAQPASLLTPSRLFTSTDRVLLHTSGNDVEVILDEAIQANGTFVQFEFHAGAEPAAAPPRSVKSDEQPYEKVWEIL
ncbi:MAG TPA: PilZ domain-containing protein [Gammaproteobacteria bacterium]